MTDGNEQWYWFSDGRLESARCPDGPWAKDAEWRRSALAGALEIWQGEPLVCRFTHGLFQWHIKVDEHELLKLMTMLAPIARMTSGPGFGMP